jgi:dGTPase
VLDAATKYPWPKREGMVKYGVYADDEPIFEWLRDGASGDRRCVEAQVMDWADDVAYSVHDLEDGMHAGHVQPQALADAGERAAVVSRAQASYLDVAVDDLEAAAQRLMAQQFWPRHFDGTLRSLAGLKRMTSELIARFAGSAALATRERHGGGDLSRYSADLVVPPETRAECAILKAVADHYVMRRVEAVQMQAREREQLTALAAAVHAAAPESLEPWLRQAWSEAPDEAGRVRVVIDQIASLTDVSAIAWHVLWVR